MKFTKTEIDLCRKIAGKHRKEINAGDWIEDDLFGRIFLVYRIVQKGFYLECVNKEDGLVTRTKNLVIPLWTIEDCLEFLREKCKDHVFLSHDEDDDEEWYLWIDEYKETQQMGKGGTPLEASLKAVLAVSEAK